jgi:hypothetical protein
MPLLFICKFLQQMLRKTRNDLDHRQLLWYLSEHYRSRRCDYILSPASF